MSKTSWVSRDIINHIRGEWTDLWVSSPVAPVVARTSLQPELIREMSIYILRMLLKSDHWPDSSAQSFNYQWQYIHPRVLFLKKVPRSHLNLAVGLTSYSHDVIQYRRSCVQMPRRDRCTEWAHNCIIWYPIWNWVDNLHTYILLRIAIYDGRSSRISTPLRSREKHESQYI